MEEIELLTLAGRNGEVIGWSVACAEASRRIREIAMQPGEIDRKALLDLADKLPTLTSPDTA